MQLTLLRPHWPGLRAFLLDALIAVVAGFFVVASARYWGDPQLRAGFGPPAPAGQLRPPVYGLLWLATLPLAARRVLPLPAAALTTLAVLGTILLRVPPGPVFLAAALQVGSLGSQVALRVSLSTTLGSVLLWLVGALIAGQGAAALAVDAVICAAVLGVPWALGHTLRVAARRRSTAQQEEERRRAYGQRLEVAREVHDVVGHSLAVITMQSGVALHVMDRRPEQARLALEAIRRQSRDALDELRATLTLYRGEVDGDRAPRRPPPRLTDLPALLETMRASGLPVELSTTGRPSGVPASVDLAGYRIVQESLTNVLRHAGVARARVRLDYRPGAIEVEIADDGRARSGGSPAPGGHGIEGMRERSAGVGGTLQAAPLPGGGFRVRARLPLAETEP